MEIRRCLQLLELDGPATLAEAHRAYRDLVRVWHPDRFAGDPGLRRRAEERLKNLNIAYSTLVRHLELREGNTTRDQERCHAYDEKKLGSTEAFFEAGTFKLLTLWHSLNRAVHSSFKGANRMKGDSDS